MTKYRPIRAANSLPDFRSENFPQMEPATGPETDRYADLYHTAQDSYFTLGRTGLIREVNLAGAELLGSDRLALLGRRFRQLVDGRDRPLFDRMLRDVFAHRLRASCELKVILSEEPSLTRTLRLEAGLQAGGYCRIIATDITERSRAEQELHLAASVYHAIPEAVMIAGADDRIITVNQAFTRLTGYAPRDAVGRPTSLLRASAPEAEIEMEIAASLEATDQWTGELWKCRKSGEEYLAALSIHAVRDDAGRILHRIFLVRDITDQRKAEAEAWKRANYDPLTDLPNRHLFQDRLRQGVRKAQRSGLHLALFFIDLDGFKEVNDTLGHAAGDVVLIEAARRITACVRDTDTTARIGGDEFTVIMSDLDDTARVGTVAEQILAALGEAFVVRGRKVRVSASIGIALYPSDAIEVEALLDRADEAMYAAKATGRGRFSHYGDNGGKPSASSYLLPP